MMVIGGRYLGKHEPQEFLYQFVYRPPPPAGEQGEAHSPINYSF